MADETDGHELVRMAICKRTRQVNDDYHRNPPPFMERKFCMFNNSEAPRETNGVAESASRRGEVERWQVLRRSMMA